MPRPGMHSSGTPPSPPRQHRPHFSAPSPRATFRHSRLFGHLVASRPRSKGCRARPYRGGLTWKDGTRFPRRHDKVPGQRVGRRLSIPPQGRRSRCRGQKRRGRRRALVRTPPGDAVRAGYTSFFEMRCFAFLVQTHELLSLECHS